MQIRNISSQLRYVHFARLKDPVVLFLKELAKMVQIVRILLYRQLGRVSLNSQKGQKRTYGILHSVNLNLNLNLKQRLLNLEATARSRITDHRVPKIKPMDCHPDSSLLNRDYAGWPRLA